MGHKTHLDSPVAMKNGRSNMTHLTAGLYIKNVWRSTTSHNNNITYFGPSILVFRTPTPEPFGESFRENLLIKLRNQTIFEKFKLNWNLQTISFKMIYMSMRILKV